MLEITRQRLEIPHLPAACLGWNVAHLSDFHAGCGRWHEWIREAVDALSILRPEIVILSGDFVDNHSREVPMILDALHGISAPNGVFAGIGNHDHRGSIPQLVSGLERIGVQVLHNRNVHLSCGLSICGVDDCHEGKPDLEASLRGVEPDAPQILISHHPNMFLRLPENRAAAVFAGHTHGGQIRLGEIGSALVCRMHLSTRYVHGWYRRGRSMMYVNRGIGVTGTKPLNRRWNCPRELTVYRLLGGDGVAGATE
jgi:predicted MPP superfamily phosphohydrolase